MTDTNNDTATVAPAAAKPAKKKAAKKAVKKAAKAKPAKKAAKAAKGTGRKASYGEDAKIKILAKENPCRANTNAHAMFAALKDGMTVGDYVKKMAAKEQDGRGNIRYWVKSGDIKVVG